MIFVELACICSEAMHPQLVRMYPSMLLSLIVDSLRSMGSRLCLLTKHDRCYPPATSLSQQQGYCIQSGQRPASGHLALRILFMNFDQSLVVSSTSTWTMAWPGHKPPYLPIVGRLGSTKHSLHHPLSWHPLLVAQSSVPPSKTVQHPKPSSGGDCPCVAHGAQPATSPNPREHQAENLWMNHACRPVLKSC